MGHWSFATQLIHLNQKIGSRFLLPMSTEYLVSGYLFILNYPVYYCEVKTKETDTCANMHYDNILYTGKALLRILSFLHCV